MTNRKESLKNQIRFLKHAIVHEGKRIRVHYSQGNYTKESRLPQGTITIYAKDYSGRLPKELRPENESDIQTDYFETDRARILPNSKHFNAVLAVIKRLPK